jgi:hypothetical protein
MSLKYCLAVSVAVLLMSVDRRAAATAGVANRLR